MSLTCYIDYVACLLLMAMWSLPCCTTDNNHGSHIDGPHHSPPHNLCKVAQHNQEAGSKKVKSHNFSMKATRMTGNMSLRHQDRQLVKS